MKIRNEIPPVYAKQAIAPGQSVEKPTETQPADTKGADRVKISAKARELQAAQQAVRQMPEIDVEKVEKIKAQLEEGTYHVDAQKTAAAILSESLIRQND